MFELYIMYRVLVLIASFHKHIHICERAIIVKAAKIEVQSVKYCNYVFFFFAFVYLFVLFVCFLIMSSEGNGTGRTGITRNDLPGKSVFLFEVSDVLLH